MGASGKLDAEIPPDAGEQCLRFKLRPAVRMLALYSIVDVTSVANSSLMCTQSDHVGESKPFNALLRAKLTISCKTNICERK